MDRTNRWNDTPRATAALGTAQGHVHLYFEFKVERGMTFVQFRFFFWMAVLAAVLATPLRAQTPPADALRAGFEQPPASAKMRCYWWWLNGNTTAETITRDLEGMKAKGLGGAILVDADGSGQQGNLETPLGPPIGSPAWIALFVHALDEAKRLGLEISLNVTSRLDVGIIGGPTVTAADAMKQLTWSRAIVDGGGDRSVQLAQPAGRNGFYRPIAVLAYPIRHGAALPGDAGSERTPIVNLEFKAASRETGFSMPASDRIMRDEHSVAGEEDADVNEVVDLRSHFNENGQLNWTFPPGTWEVLRIGYTDTPTPDHLRDSAGTPLGLPLDALSAGAFDDYWRDVVMPLLTAAKPYIGTSLRYLVTDSWEAGGANWTGNFREEFKRRRGYDPLPYLPIVAGRILGSRSTSNRFLFDLRRTVADLIAENYYDRFANHARKMGLGTHPEAGGPHGAPIDALENFRSTTFPQTEFWVVSGTHRATPGDRFFVKEASSAAHIYGKPYAAAEGPTSMNPAAWSESLSGDLQPTFDTALTEGLNRLYWHEFTSSPAKYGLPGEEYFAGTHLNPQVTWWQQAAPFVLAFNRAQFLMQQGGPVSDLLYFYGDQVPGFVRLRDDDPAHVLPGYDYDVVDEDALLHRLKFEGPGLRTPEGLQYRALALPHSRSLSYASLKWVQGFVKQGGVIVGQKPSGPLGLIPDDEKKEYKHIVKAMWAGCDGNSSVAHFGLGTIYCTSDSRSALTAMGVAPDFTFRLNEAETSSGEPAFEYVHRRTQNADIYFVRNTWPRELEATLLFRVAGREPELWSADDDVTTPALVYRVAGDGRTEIPLTFPARGSVFIIFQRPSARHLVALEKEGSPLFPSIDKGAGVFSVGDRGFVAKDAGTYVATDSEGKKQTIIAQPADVHASASLNWTLSFPAGWGAPLSVPWDHFTSWTESTDPGIRYFSGTATYHAKYQLAKSIAGAGSELWLELGQVREIATVTLNGKRVNTVWREPFAARIDPFLHVGENIIEIKVSNLWPNRLIGDLQPSAAKGFTQTNVRAYTMDSPLIPSGILQPVTVHAESVLHWR
ncbi:MAG: glycosyl hydrolase [Terracidiphilus sp.]